MTEQTQPEALAVAALLECLCKRLGEHPSGSRYRAVAELRRLHAENEQLKAQLAQRERPALTDEQIDAAAKTIAACLDYPWEYMADTGREHMRSIVKDVIRVIEEGDPT